MKIDFRKIDFKQGKYWFPLVVFVPIVAIAYFSCQMFTGTASETGMVTDSINTTMPAPEGNGLLNKYAEMEDNNSFLLSDYLEPNRWVAGEISSAEDLDWFYFHLDEPGEVTFEVVPYYSDDMEYLLCGVLSLNDTDDDVELIDALVPTEENGYDALVGTISFDAAGDYFLLICVDESYPYDEASFYAARVSW